RRAADRRGDRDRPRRDHPLPSLADPLQLALEPRRAADGQRPVRLCRRTTRGARARRPAARGGDRAPRRPCLPAGDRLARASAAVSRRWLVLGAAVTLAAALGVGLWLGLRGGDDAEPTRQQYLARVSTVCRSYARRLERVAAPSDPAAYGNASSSVEQVVPLLRAQEAAMRTVRAPSALGPRLDRLFA